MKPWDQIPAVFVIYQDKTKVRNDMKERKTSILASKEGAAKLSIFSIGLLIVMKVVASVYTGSVGIRADAFHSVIDISGAIIGLIAIRLSAKPPDKQHAFGHGKAENIAGIVIGGLIIIAAGTIMYEAVERLRTGATLELVTVGIYITLAAVVINLVVSRYAFRVAKATDSLALEATARDLLADLYSSCAVLIGLALVKLTGITAFDSIVALIVALLIGKTAYHTIKRSVGGLMDSKLPEIEEAAIRSSILEHSGKVVGFHKLRTRKAGSQRFVDLHLVVPKDSDVCEAHDLCNHLERDIKKKVQRISITIHVEPCAIVCERCSVSCAIRK